MRISDQGLDGRRKTRVGHDTSGGSDFLSDRVENTVSNETLIEWDTFQSLGNFAKWIFLEEIPSNILQIKYIFE
jgi:hypothetical protein